jgi:hypothetical protein
MKQKDIVLFVVIGFFSLVVSLVLSNLLLNTEEDHKLETAVVTPITTEFDDEDKPYFGPDATNPTQTIKINENNNDQPFNR